MSLPNLTFKSFGYSLMTFLLVSIWVIVLYVRLHCTIISIYNLFLEWLAIFISRWHRSDVWRGRLCHEFWTDGAAWTEPDTSLDFPVQSQCGKRQWRSNFSNVFYCFKVNFHFKFYWLRQVNISINIFWRGAGFYETNFKL